MANTYVDYTASAGQTDFAFNFPYLEDEHIKVYINSIEKLPSDFTISTSPATKIVLNVAATGGETVRVRRKSQPNDDLVDFVNGSILTESELDRGYRHTRYLAEEASEFASVSLELEGSLEGSQITNGTVSTTKITDGAITEGKLADGAVTTAKLGADAVDGTKIADDSIDSEHYVDGSIDTAHIADNQITADKISDSDATFNIQSDGNVGIGTDTPAKALHVKGGVRIESNDPSFTNTTTIEPNETSGGLKFTGSSDGFHFDIGNTPGSAALFVRQPGISAPTGKAAVIGINTINPSIHSQLDFGGTEGGVLLPRLTTTQRNLIGNVHPAASLSSLNGSIIYNTSVNKFQGIANGQWVNLH